MLRWRLKDSECKAIELKEKSDKTNAKEEERQIKLKERQIELKEKKDAANAKEEERQIKLKERQIELKEKKDAANAKEEERQIKLKLLRSFEVEFAACPEDPQWFEGREQKKLTNRSFFESRIDTNFTKQLKRHSPLCPGLVSDSFHLEFPQFFLMFLVAAALVLGFMTRRR